MKNTLRIAVGNAQGVCALRGKKLSIKTWLTACKCLQMFIADAILSYKGDDKYG